MARRGGRLGCGGALGEQSGYRNAQATVLAPTGTIGLLMDCDTTGIEPDFALVKFKKLAGGGYFKIVNQSVPEALRRLRYSRAEIAEIVAYVSGTNTLLGAPHVNRASLKARGLTDEELGKIETALAGRVRSLARVRAVGRRQGSLRAPRRHGREAGQARLQPAQATSASRTRRSRRRTTSSSVA